ncbi:hypothetical protein HPB47_020910 [Ixodes persulcatus]|uniref:Uncharacterized protein n=1 Tax=Ixodes persulcatus TaxID=34615 RepID=A0AC60QES6_IXOPE|nr:hypothetical protein HPB47_020910 [Ixodes persulcatus]
MSRVPIEEQRLAEIADELDALARELKEQDALIEVHVKNENLAEEYRAVRETQSVITRMRTRIRRLETRTSSSIEARGVSQRELAGRTGRPLSTVNRIIQAYRDENRLADAVRAPRSRVTDENDDLRIVGAASDDAFQSSSDIRKELGLLVSTKTIQRRLREAGLHSHIAAQKPLLTARHKQLRLAFAQDHEAWESHWNQGLGPLVRIDGTLTSRAYAEIIDQVLLPYILGGPFPDGCFTFQQTGAPYTRLGLFENFWRTDV